ncbi:hypothetical protein REPUB_Repub12eG0208500 [Reevesia pubescens]
MSVIFWNTRGAASSTFLAHAKDLISLHRPDMLILVEPRISGNKAERVIRRLGFDEATRVYAVGFSGGIWILWNTSFGRVQILSKTQQFITLLVDDKLGFSWAITAVYASPIPAVRDTFWQFMRDFDELDNISWLLIGDFNQILSSDEKQGGNRECHRRMQQFMDVMLCRGWFDLGASGCRFTWTNKQPLSGLIKKRLDRAVCNVRWRHSFQEAEVSNLPRLYGDHCPLLLQLHGISLSHRRLRPFRFEMAWLLHEEFPNLIRASWDNNSDLLMNLNSFTSIVKEWNQLCFGNIFRRKRHLQARIQGTQKALEQAPNPFLFELEKKLLADYEQTLLQEEVLWFQKSRSQWIQFGDKNTNFFHTSTIIRRRKNKISALKDSDNIWCYDQDDLKRLVITHFQAVYTTEPVNTNFEELLHMPSFRFNDQQINSLMHLPDDDEILLVLSSMSPFKSPGPDGYQAAFYQRNWDVVSSSVCSFVRSAFINGCFDENVSKVLISLIPKVDHPKTLSQLRPISLCNVSVKLISKIIVSRLRPFLGDIIHPTQSSFVHGRSSTDNIVVLQEAVHSLNKMKGAKGGLIMKVDLEKAYDRVNWDFLRWVLMDLGLPSSLIALIMYCITSTTMSILWNGDTTDAFKPTRGLRQGDPLSPYLFVLCLQKLSSLIDNSVQNGEWQPLKLSRDGPLISHIFFADDLVLFGRASIEQCEVMLDCLNIFCSVSGEKVNFQKSMFYTSPNVRTEIIRELELLSGMRHTLSLGKYLGVQIHDKRVTKNTFSDLLDKVKKRLSGWKAKQLSLAGRQTLVQSVFSTIATYTMQSSRLPVSVSNAVDRLNRNFLWGGDENHKKISLVKWDQVCQPKRTGGFGLRQTSLMNTALLAKLGWKLMTGNYDLWAQVLHSKYLKDTDFIKAAKKPGSSYTWRSILSSQVIVAKGCSRLVLNGKQTNFWYDEWLTDKPLAACCERQIPLGMTRLMVSDCWDGTAWNRETMSLLPNGLQETLSLVQPLQEGDDKTIWTGSSNGVFSVKSAYDLMVSASHQSPVWNQIWKLDVLPRVKSFLWLLNHNRLLTKEQCHRRGLLPDTICSRCLIDAEDRLHLLRDCPDSRLIWSYWFRGVHLDHFCSLNFNDWLMYNLRRKNVFVDQGIQWPILFSYICWFIWSFRNKSIFEVGFQWPNNFRDIVTRYVTQYLLHSSKIGTISVKRQVYIAWQPPPEGFVKLNVDGAAASCPGEITAGGICRDSLGHWLFGFISQLGYGCILQAELYAIFSGLNLAWQRGYKKVILESDSMLAVNKVNKPLEERDPLTRIIIKCKRLLLLDWDCNVCHIYREGHRCADMLADLAKKCVWGLTVLDDPPSTIYQIMCVDYRGVAYPRACVI